MRNEMMSHPVVHEKVQNFLRQQPLKISPALAKIEQWANERRVPIIPRETAAYLYQLVSLQAPQRILEVGTAIGFSSALFVEADPKNVQVTTIDRFDTMYNHAKENWQRLGYQDQIDLLVGDAADILPTLQTNYDLIFLDAAKAQYIKFLPDALRLLAPNGVLLIDDVLQGGTIFDDIATIRHRNKGIHRRLNELLTAVYQNPDLNVSLLPLGDGVLQISWREY